MVLEVSRFAGMGHSIFVFISNQRLQIAEKKEIFNTQCQRLITQTTSREMNHRNQKEAHILTVLIAFSLWECCMDPYKYKCIHISRWFGKQSLSLPMMTNLLKIPHCRNYFIPSYLLFVFLLNVCENVDSWWESLLFLLEHSQNKKHALPTPLCISAIGFIHYATLTSV